MLNLFKVAFSGSNKLHKFKMLKFNTSILESLKEDDKILHMISISLICCFIFLLLLLTNLQAIRVFWIAIISSFIIGLLKEFYDGFFRTGFSFNDLIANTISIILWSVIIFYEIWIYKL